MDEIQVLDIKLRELPEKFKELNSDQAAIIRKMLIALYGRGLRTTMIADIAKERGLQPREQGSIVSEVLIMFKKFREGTLDDIELDNDILKRFSLSPDDTDKKLDDLMLRYFKDLVERKKRDEEIAKENTEGAGNIAMAKIREIDETMALLNGSFPELVKKAEKKEQPERKITIH